MEITTILGVYAAVLSTGLGAVTLIQFIKSHKRLKICLNVVFDENDLNLDRRTLSNPMLLVECINPRKEPIYIEAIGIKSTQGDDIYLSYMKNQTKVTQGTAYKFQHPITAIKRSLHGRAVKYLWVSDQTGKRYRSSRKRLKEIISGNLLEFKK